MIAVVGAGGFIGRHIQLYIKSKKANYLSHFLMVYFNSVEKIDNSLNKISFYEFINSSQYVQKVKTIIMVSGNSQRLQDESNFDDYVKRDYQYIFSLCSVYKANMILLSSSAVYDGYQGEVYEDFPIFPASLYGISKYNSELVSNYCLNNIQNRKLIIYRLMYAFGKYEKKNRFLQNIADCVKNNKILKLTGYNNYLNPVSADFVAEILVKTAMKISIFPKREIINLSSNRNYSILEIVKILKSITDFRYELFSKEPELIYWNSIKKLSKYLKKMNISEEDTAAAIQDYFYSLVQTG